MGNRVSDIVQCQVKNMMFRLLWSLIIKHDWQNGTDLCHLCFAYFFLSLFNLFFYAAASYFVRGAQYWRYDHSSGSLGQGFPRNFHNDWLGCGKPQLLVESAASKSGGEGASNAQVLNFQPMTIALSVLAAMLSQLFILNFQRIWCRLLNFQWTFNMW